MSSPEDDSLIYELALHLTPGIGNVNIKQLISHCGSAEAVLKTPKGKLAKIPGIGTVTANKIQSFSRIEEAKEELYKARNAGIQAISYTGAEYPPNLKRIPDAPAVLFVKGSLPSTSKKSVAIVGTRNATEYGKDITKNMIEELKSYNPVIVSGLAYGIDVTAHRSALDNNLETVAVMASGADIIYPSAHKTVAQDITAHGALITENKIGTAPDAPRFPARNRIIAGMTDCTIVIEAARKGGALITAEIANGYNKDVFAVPGNIGNKYSEGCNQLIKSNKAHLITSAEDIAYIMGWELDQSKEQQSKPVDLSKLDDEGRVIANILEQYASGIHIDQLVLQSGLSATQVASILLNLEFQNLVKAMPGKIYQLKT